MFSTEKKYNELLVVEVMEVLFRDRVNEEKKEENKRFEVVIERHLALVPRVKETQVKSEVRRGR